MPVLAHLPGLTRAKGRIASVKEWAEREGGVSYERLREPEHIRRREPRPLEGDVHTVFEREREHRHPEVFRLRLKQARLAGSDSLLLSSDRRVVEESHFDPEHVDASLAVRRRLPHRRRLRGLHMTIATPWCNTYFHWLLDTLPRLALLPLEELPDVPVIVPASLSPAQSESLRLAGLADARTVDFNYDHLLVDELIWPSRVGRTGNPPQWVVEWLRARFAPPPGPRRRRIYASRADAPSRRAVNEDEVAAALAQLGFERVLVSELSFSQQVSVFSEAEAVVGLHGGNLSNVVFASDATIIEVFHPGYVNACYYAVADVAGHRHRYLVGEAAGEGGDISVDVERLKAGVEQALAS